ncbi:Yip1-like protein [Flavobacterium croceum DSM 17960]|uniref:Yip1-like protein n=1 Tax=Flavobacterium croceum DSM 17960 TaxID=1121886 RepID=A0A2S4NB80_9FLAO|nr:YIP1 family protein [Flavobacterium croceum]POS02958.1 Yip1-like protein [Flavobacterium croceum DSM 17960]
MNWKLIFNPFEQISERKLMQTGVLFALLAGIYAYYFGVVYDGVLDIHLFENASSLVLLFSNVIIVVCMSLVLYIFGKYINTKTRFIDVLTAVLWFRIPFYVSATLTTLPVFAEIEHQLKNSKNIQNIQFDTFTIVLLLFVTFVFLLALVYAFVLLINGFKTATNIKKAKHFVWFTVLILLLEILTKFIINTMV